MCKGIRKGEINTMVYATHMTEEDIVAIEPFHEYFVKSQH